jgi:hypothetical protein
MQCALDAQNLSRPDFQSRENGQCHVSVLAAPTRKSAGCSIYCSLEFIIMRATLHYYIH